MFGYIDDKKWVREGAEVAIVNTSGWGSRLVGTSTIEKVLKTQIVLANGRRFKASDLSEHGGSRYHSDRIVAADNPLVASIEAEKVLQAAKSAAHKAVDHWQRSREDLTRLREAIAAMQAYEVSLAAEYAEFGDDEED